MLAAVVAAVIARAWERLPQFVDEHAGAVGCGGVARVDEADQAAVGVDAVGQHVGLRAIARLVGAAR